MARPPKHNPQRGNAAVGIVRLPASGRKGPTPPFPLYEHAVIDYRTREETVWEQLWKTPQAVAWERLGWTRAVARYCRMVVASEIPRAEVHCKQCGELSEAIKLEPALLGQVAAMEDRLGLTPKAMRLLLWIIDHDEIAEARQAKSATGGGRRIAAVDPSAAGS